MKKNLLLASTVLMFLAGCVLAGTGLLLELRLDEGEASAVMGIGRDEWGEFHFIAALVFLGLSIAHVLLNWSWVAGQFRQRKLIAIVVPAIVAAMIIGGLLLLPGTSGYRGNSDSERHGINGDRD